MAVSGIILFLFIVAHLAGNLLVFAGQNQLNAYGQLLHAVPEVLWGARIALLAAVITHIFAGWKLWLRNKASRPLGYKRQKTVGATWASRSMALSGLIILVFIVLHILHFTIGTINPAALSYRDGGGRHDIYRMLVEAFTNPWFAWFYVLSVGLLSIHLSHGVSSFFRTLGWVNEAYRPIQVNFARVFALLLFLGFSSIPLSIQFGFVKISTPTPLAQSHET